jgi:hypothetical protein
MRRAAFSTLATLCPILAGTILLVTPARTFADTVTGISKLDQANRLSLFHDYSIDAVGLTTGSIPGSAGTGVLAPAMGDYASTEPAEPGRSFEINATPLAGYDSNPEARRFSQGSPFAGLDLDAVYYLDLGPGDPNLGSPTQFQFAYDLTGAVYGGTTFEADTLQQTLSATYHRWLFHDTVVVGVAFDDQYTTEHAESFLNSFDATPSVEWLFTPQLSLEANYEYSRMDYFIHAVPRRDPTSNRSTVNTKFHFYSLPQVRGDIPESPDQLGDILRATLSRLTIGYAAVFNQTDGLDYRYEANRVSIGVEGIRIPRLHDVTFDVNYAHEWDNFMDPSTEGPIVLAGNPKQKRRKDHVDVFTLRSNARLFDLPHDRGTLSTFLQWDILADRSTIPARHFNEFIISGGINYRY